MVKKSSDAKLEQIKGVSQDYFEICRMVRRKIKACTQESSEVPETEVLYLWICVSSKGLQRVTGKHAAKVAPLTMDQWLNVVDEASALGVSWLVLTVVDPLADCGSVWEISKWAQKVHGMAVGFHLKADETLGDKEIVSLAGLDPDRTRVLMRAVSRKVAADLEKRGVKVWAANPQPDGEKPNCQGPTRMIFVNENGVLYTCGLVKENSDYLMGHVEASRLKSVIGDPAIPHGVENDLHVVSEGCDGCPALLANFFK